MTQPTIDTAESTETRRSFIAWMRSMMLYCGISREGYEEGLETVRQKNTATLIMGAAMTTILFAGLFLSSFFSQNLVTGRPLYGMMLSGCALVLLLSLTLVRRNHRAALPVWYLLFAIFGAYGIYLNTFLHPDLSAVTVCVFVVAGPLLIIDRPLRVFGYMICLMATFIFCAVHTKTPYLAFADSVNLVSCLFVSIVIFTRLTRVKLREMHQARMLEIARDLDGLTGLLNKSGFRAAVLGKLKDTEDQGALVLMDVDNFKHINDSYGHLCGDDILQRTGACLRMIAGPGDLCGRFGGDEFVMYFSREQAQTLPERLERLMELLHANITLPDSADRFGVSIGAVVRTGDGAGYETLLHCADVALYDAKQQGKNRFQIFRG